MLSANVEKLINTMQKAQRELPEAYNAFCLVGFEAGDNDIHPRAYFRTYLERALNGRSIATAMTKLGNARYVYGGCLGCGSSPNVPISYLIAGEIPTPYMKAIALNHVQIAPDHPYWIVGAQAPAGLNWRLLCGRCKDMRCMHCDDRVDYESHTKTFRRHAGPYTCTRCAGLMAAHLVPFVPTRQHLLGLARQLRRERGR